MAEHFSDANDEININKNDIMDSHSNHRSPNNQSMDICDREADDNDAQNCNCENIIGVENNIISDNKLYNSPETKHDMDDECECCIQQKSDLSESNNDTYDTSDENDYATISQNFIPSHHIGAFDNFQALKLLASVAAKLQYLNNRYDDIQNNNDVDSIDDYLSDWEDIDEYEKFHEDLRTKPVNS